MNTDETKYEQEKYLCFFTKCLFVEPLQGLPTARNYRNSKLLSSFLRFLSTCSPNEWGFWLVIRSGVVAYNWESLMTSPNRTPLGTRIFSARYYCTTLYLKAGQTHHHMRGRMYHYAITLASHVQRFKR